MVLLAFVFSVGFLSVCHGKDLRAPSSTEQLDPQIEVAPFQNPGKISLSSSTSSHYVPRKTELPLSELGTFPFQPTSETLRTAVDLWCNDRDTAITTHGDISNWDTSLVTDMSYLFDGKNGFDDDISGWDVSQVTSMSFMFRNAKSFNQPIGGWDVSQVTSLNAMFSSANSFNQPIGGWDVSQVTDMTKTFFRAYDFNQPLGEWDVSKVTSMSSMFFSCGNYNQPMGEWDVSQVTSMSHMFRGVQFNQPIGGWDVSRVTSMSFMFKGAEAFNQPLGQWDVSNVTSMTWMFSGASSFDQPLCEWDVSRPLFDKMFYNANCFNEDLKSCWDLTQEEYDKMARNGDNCPTADPTADPTAGPTAYDCSSVDDWSASRKYKEDEKAVYGGILYEALKKGKNNDPVTWSTKSQSQWNKWISLGQCTPRSPTASPVPIQCNSGGVSPDVWNKGKKKYQIGEQVLYEGYLYEAVKRVKKNKRPDTWSTKPNPDFNFWTNLGECLSSTPSTAPTYATDCAGPFSARCENKIQKLAAKDSAWFAWRGMDGSRCSMQEFLSTAPRSDCPPL